MQQISDLGVPSPKWFIYSTTLILKGQEHWGRVGTKGCKCQKSEIPVSR